ncbi:hypothetical protein [Candidatus Solirubrobacter pratensis]|uniref:hypothetical protein n=1 Tax=Candidatus Solirubrobacter pratensis TaxID=1298857 RepID=UPI0012DDDE66|nr:hypothetical protein [Candidatus Solirubrobacter pratensis]
MCTGDAVDDSPTCPRRLSFDDAYTAWFLAQSSCREALHAWARATPGARCAAYRNYRTALNLEEAAAYELAQLHSSRQAA